VRRPLGQRSPKAGATRAKGRYGLAGLRSIREISTFEIVLWACVVFLLTAPFAFWLMDIDPGVGFVRDVGSMRTAAFSQWRLYAVRAAIVVIAALITRPSVRIGLTALKRLWPLWLFLGWAAVSISWSDFPVSSANSIVSTLLLLLVAMLCCIRLSSSLAARALLLSGILAATTCISFAWLLPLYGLHQPWDVGGEHVHAGAWRGVYLHKNHMGQVLAILVGGLLPVRSGILRSKPIKYSLLVVLMGLIILSESASSVIAIPLGFFLRLWLVEMSSRSKFLSALYVIPFAILIYLVLNDFLSFFDKDMTFTGRTYIWDIAGRWFAFRPWLGYGFNTLTYGGFSVELMQRRAVTDPHNGYLDIILGTGIVGLALWGVVVWQGISIARKQYQAGGLARETSIVLAGAFLTWLTDAMVEACFRPSAPAAGLGYFTLCALLLMPPVLRTSSENQRDAGPES